MNPSDPPARPVLDDPAGGSETPRPVELCTVDEVARALRVCRWTVYDWARSGRIPVLRVGRTLRFILDEVIEALRHATERHAHEKAARGAARASRAPRQQQPPPKPPAAERPADPPRRRRKADRGTKDERLRAVLDVTQVLRK